MCVNYRGTKGKVFFQADLEEKASTPHPHTPKFSPAG